MLYFDTSALLKLTRREAESDALADWLASWPDADWVSSSLVEVELPRALMRVEPSRMSQVPTVLGDLDLLEIDAQVRADAAALQPATLRSLDVIHLATALELSNGLEAFLTYDKRLAQAAHGAGLRVNAPA